jgi:hypothetical protein
MPTLTFPIQPDGLVCDMLVGLDGNTTAALYAAGQPILAPARCRALIDTGTDVTCVAATALRGLGLNTPARRRTTHTVGGQIAANLFSVSVGVKDFRNPAIPMLVVPTLLVMELLGAPPNLDALIGLDILRTIRLVVDGPGGVFTLEW